MLIAATKIKLKKNSIAVVEPVLFCNIQH